MAAGRRRRDCWDRRVEDSREEEGRDSREEDRPAVGNWPEVVVRWDQHFVVVVGVGSQRRDWEVGDTDCSGLPPPVVVGDSRD